MAKTGNERERRALARGLLAAALALAVSGCAYSLSEFAVERQPAVLAEAAPDAPATDAAMPLEPAALVETEEQTATVAAAPRPTSRTFPILGVPPNQPPSKLLTLEEKAAVIAELEALAKSQGAATAKARQTARAECKEDAALALDPEERLRREREGLEC